MRNNHFQDDGVFAAPIRIFMCQVYIPGPGYCQSYQGFNRFF